MADKVKPLKIESPSTGGTQTNPFPVEADPDQDYLAARGIAFNNLDTFLLERLGRSLVEFFPTLHQNVTYSGVNLSAIDFYNSSSFVNDNRIARYDFTFTGADLTSETLKIYDTNGTTVLRTYTWTHLYSGVDYQSSGLVIT